MNGLLVSHAALTATREVLEDNNVSPIESVHSFGGEVLVFADDDTRVIAAVTATLMDLDVRHLEGPMADLSRKLHNSKPLHLSTEEYQGYREGYAKLHEARLLKKPNMAAHKAWVTMREWSTWAQAGIFTHRVAIVFQAGGQRFTYEDVATCEAHGKALIAKARRKIGKNVQVVYKSITSLPMWEAEAIREDRLHRAADFENESKARLERCRALISSRQGEGA